MLKAQFLPHYEELHNGNRCPVTVRTAHKNLLPNPRFTPYFTLHCSTEGDGHLSCFPEQLVDCQLVEDEVKLLPRTTTSPRCHRFHLSYKSLAEKGAKEVFTSTSSLSSLCFVLSILSFQGLGEEVMKSQHIKPSNYFSSRVQTHTTKVLF